MLIKNSQKIDFDNFDFVITGSGPAGISLALRLEEAGKKILIIEAGNLEVSKESQDLYSGEVIGDKYFNLDEARLRCFGGSSGHWGGNCFELDDTDFKNWPIKKTDLLKYKNKAKEILNLKGDFDKKKSYFEDFEEISFLQSDVRFGDKYLEHIKNSRNIFLILNTPLLKIIPYSMSTNEIEKIVVLLENKYFKEIKIKKLILCSGGIENSRLLLWSKISSNSNFLQELPIGHYWSDHPTGDAAQFILNKELNKKYENLENIQISPSKEYLIKNNLNNCRFNFKKIKNNNKDFKKYIKDFVCLAPNLGKKLLENSIGSKSIHCFGAIKFSTEQEGIYENKITLDNFKDKLGIPRTKINWNIKDNVFQTLIKTLENLGNQFIEKNIGRIGIDKTIYDNNFKKINDVYGNHHHIGGTIMGKNKKSSVVDSNLKIHSLKNLYVAGSSVFSSAGHANPTYTIVMLSLRLGDHLLEI